MFSQVKLIAEPWDLGEGGYQVGNFPPLGGMERPYRDSVRRFWKGDGNLGRPRLPFHRQQRPLCGGAAQPMPASTT